MAKISSGGNRTYLKLKEEGESCIGELVKFDTDVEGTYGLENNATLRDAEGNTIILRCQTVLANIFKDNPQLVGQVVRPVMTGEGKPKKGGYPAKLFDVDFWATWDEVPEEFTDGDSFSHGANAEPSNAAAQEEAELEAKLAAARARRAAAA